MTAVGATPSTAGVADALVELAVLTRAEAAAPDLVITDLSVSHRAFRVNTGRAELFVKQADPWRSQGRDLSAEAAVYRLAAGTAQLADIVPPCRAVSGDDTTIVLEAVPGVPLSETALAVGDVDAKGMSVLCRYGRAVAGVHAVRPSPFGQPPWLLSALEPGWGGYPWLPVPVRHLLLRLAATLTFRAGFARAAADWRADTLVHGDLRWSNALAAVDVAPIRVWLVDWELACLGDAAWDLGSVLADLLGGAALHSFRTGAVPDVWPAAHAFLAGYRAAAGARDWQPLIERSVVLAGVRLVQTLVEHAHQGAGWLAATEPVLLPWAAALLAAPDAIVAELARGANGPCRCHGNGT